MKWRRILKEHVSSMYEVVTIKEKRKEKSQVTLSVSLSYITLNFTCYQMFLAVLRFILICSISVSA